VPRTDLYQNAAAEQCAARHTQPLGAERKMTVVVDWSIRRSGTAEGGTAKTAAKPTWGSRALLRRAAAASARRCCCRLAAAIAGAAAQLPSMRRSLPRCSLAAAAWSISRWQ